MDRTARLLQVVLVVTLATPSSASDPHPNNSWHTYNDSSVVYVFVHGIFSNSSECWTSDKGVYWPDILANDIRFDHPSIFLGGYNTSLMAGEYGIPQASDELLSYLRVKDLDQREPVLARGNLVFVAHSTGGLVVRYMLERHSDLFKDKALGLVLLASPSRGSAWSNRLRWLQELFGNKMAEQLERGNDLVLDLDSRFAEIQTRLPYLSGVDIFESKFVVPGFFSFFPSTYVVRADDSASYFGASKTVPDVDHFAISKPNSPTDASHQFLWEFVDTRFKEVVQARTEALRSSPKEADSPPSGESPVEVRVFPIHAEKTGNLIWAGMAMGYMVQRVDGQFLRAGRQSTLYMATGPDDKGLADSLRWLLTLPITNDYTLSGEYVQLFRENGDADLTIYETDDYRPSLQFSGVCRKNSSGLDVLVFEYHYSMGQYPSPFFARLVEADSTNQFRASNVELGEWLEGDPVSAVFNCLGGASRKPTGGLPCSCNETLPLRNAPQESTRTH